MQVATLDFSPSIHRSAGAVGMAWLCHVKMSITRTLFASLKAKSYQKHASLCSPRGYATTAILLEHDTCSVPFRLICLCKPAVKKGERLDDGHFGTRTFQPWTQTMRTVSKGALRWTTLGLILLYSQRKCYGLYSSGKARRLV